MPRRKRWSFLMGPLEHRSVRWLDDFHRGDLTIGGRTLFWGMLLSGAMLVGGLTQPLVICFGFCGSALMLGGIIGIFFRPRLQVTRHIGAFPSAGEVFHYRVDVTNTGHKVARNVFIEERGLPAGLRPVENAPMIDSLEPGESTFVTLKLRCLSRDAYELNRLQGASVFPSGLVKSGRRSRQSDRLVVYPQVTPVRDLQVPHSRNHQPGGIAVASHVGESTEFLGCREWRQGDRLRDIHWPSSARSGRLITREYQEEYFVRLAVILDVEAPRARDEPRLERAISLTAGITDALARLEYIVDIFAAGDEVYHFQAGRAIAHLDNILELLSCLESGHRLDTEALLAVLLPQARQLSAVIFVMMDWDQRRSELVQILKSNGLAVRVICLNEKGQPSQDLDPTEIVEVSA